MEFALRRNRVLVLAFLAAVFRKGEDLDDAITQFWQKDKELRKFYEKREAERESQKAEWGFTPKEEKLPPYVFAGRTDEMERRVAETGISWEQLAHEDNSGWPKPPSRAYVAHLLAQQLEIPSRLEPIRVNRRWELIEVPY